MSLDIYFVKEVPDRSREFEHGTDSGDTVCCDGVIAVGNAVHEGPKLCLVPLLILRQLEEEPPYLAVILQISGQPTIGPHPRLLVRW